MMLQIIFRKTNSLLIILRLKINALKSVICFLKFFYKKRGEKKLIIIKSEENPFTFGDNYFFLAMCARDPELNIFFEGWHYFPDSVKSAFSNLGFSNAFPQESDARNVFFASYRDGVNFLSFLNLRKPTSISQPGRCDQHDRYDLCIGCRTTKNYGVNRNLSPEFYESALRLCADIKSSGLRVAFVGVDDREIKKSIEILAQHYGIDATVFSSIIDGLIAIDNSRLFTQYKGGGLASYAIANGKKCCLSYKRSPHVLLTSVRLFNGESLNKIGIDEFDYLIYLNIWLKSYAK